MMANLYRPHLLRIAAMRDETPDVRTLELEPADPAAGEQLDGWRPGQFGEFCVFGAGESVFALSNAPPGNGRAAIECTFRTVGKVTHALRSLSPGSTVGYRGPYGNSFPVEAWRGKHIVFLGGGIGMAALRAAIQVVLRHRDEYRQIHVLNGARRVADLVYREDMEDWTTVAGVEVICTVDPDGQTEDWKGRVGLLPDVFESLSIEPADRIVVACGPPIMLRFLFRALDRTGFGPEQVVTTLENKMKCGIGLCGRCNVGPFFVCRDGPVVTRAQLTTLPADL